MVSKILNFPDAMRLAQIITKYFDTESIKEMTGVDFAYKFFSEISDDESALVMQLLKTKVEKTDADNIMISCVQAMVKNNLLDLLSNYKQIGFE